MKDKLTEKQERFVQNLIKGMSQVEAYRQVYSTKNMSDNACYREASVLSKNPKVSQRYKELAQKTENAVILTAQERLEWLSRVIRGEDDSTSDKLKAIDLMNKMQGEYSQTQRVVASVAYEDHLKKVVDEDEY